MQLATAARSMKIAIHFQVVSYKLGRLRLAVLVALTRSDSRGGRRFIRVVFSSRSAFRRFRKRRRPARLHIPGMRTRPSSDNPPAAVDSDTASTCLPCVQHQTDRSAHNRRPSASKGRFTASREQEWAQLGLKRKDATRALRLHLRQATKAILHHAHRADRRCERRIGPERARLASAGRTVSPARHRTPPASATDGMPPMRSQ